MMVWLIPLILMLCGVVTIFLGLAGCFGCAMYSRLASAFYFGFVIVVVVLEIGLGTYWLLRRPSYKDYVDTNIRTAFDENLREDMRFEWIVLQRKVFYEH